MTTDDKPTVQYLEPEAQALVPTSHPNILAAPVVDDAPLWVAWEGAQNSWLASKRRRSGGDNTVRSYKLACRQFFEWAGVEPWRVSPGHAQEWANHLAAHGKEDPRTGETGPLADSTVALKLAALSSFYDYVQRRYTSRTPDGRSISLWPADRANPFVTVERPKISAYGRAIYPTTDELKAILSEINTDCLTGKRDFALLYTIASTCRRCSEILNLKWSDIIRQKKDGNYVFRYRYKGGEERESVLNKLAYQAIRAYLTADGRPPEDLTEGDDYIFVPLYPDRITRINPGTDPNPNHPISNHQANNVLKKYGRRVDVDKSKCHIHALRHAGARLRAEQQTDEHGTVDYMIIMDLLGHSSLAVTQIYTKKVLTDPEDPGGDAAAKALLPKRRRRKPPQPKQERLL